MYIYKPGVPHQYEEGTTIYVWQIPVYNLNQLIQNFISMIWDAMVGFYVHKYKYWYLYGIEMETYMSPSWQKQYDKELSGETKSKIYVPPT